MKNKSIWIINQYTGSNKHGQQTRFYHIGKELIKEGYHVSIISGSYSHQFTKQPIAKKIITKEKINELNYYWIKTIPYKNPAGIKRFINMIIFSINLNLMFFKKIKKPNIIIISVPSLFPILNALLFKLLYKSKIILDVRDLWPLTFIKLHNYSKLHPLIITFLILEKIAYKYSDKVISTLNNSWKYMVKHGLKKDNFIYTPIGFEKDNYKITKPKNNILENLKNKKQIKIGYIGSITKANNIENLLNTAKQLNQNKNFIFIIIGDGAEKNNIVKKYKKYENIKFFNKVKHIDVPFYMNECDILYKGNLNNELYKYGISPLKLIEYMYAQKIIIHATNIENDPVQEAKCGFSIESQNSTQLEDCIIAISKMNEETKKTYGKNGKEFVLKNYNYTNITKSLITTINSIK